MASLKFIHAADLHLDSPFAGLKHLPASVLERLKESTFAAFSRLVDLTVKEKADFLILAGDLFDGENRSLKAQLRLKKEFEKLKHSGISVYVIHGNHDHLSGKWLNIDWPENVRVFSHEQAECLPFLKDGKTAAHLYGYSYPERAVKTNITDQYIKTGDAPFHIGLLHGSVEGGSEDHDVYCPFSLKDLERAGFDYWALGHIHKREILSMKETMAIYPGNIQGRHRKESGEKGCYAVTLGDGGPQAVFHPVHDVLWMEQEINMEGLDTAGELIRLCRIEKEQFRQKGVPAVLTIRLTGGTPLAAELKQAEVLEDLLHSLNDEEDRRDFVWIGKLQDYTSLPADREQLKQDSVFYRDFFAVTEQYRFLEQAAAPLYSNSSVRKYIGLFSEEEQKEIIREAELLVLSELLKEGGGEK
ncbi:DNA repair exonuclease [Bacillus mangrovi]|uniref:DNA repair exonuclease n=1 Tax=Metabacillus mangrovi TaxID=1491830 RepID=A0A7X2V453_9BACI|nr:DNA repair exonuclease [Metabacillus mangrovi]MTH53382.1 DNA repair exonuclease [Metabacillus mangrovi]